MTNLFNGELADILPENFSKEVKTQALSCAVQKAVQAVISYAQKVQLYEIDIQPDDILDAMAIELRTQYYSPEMDIDLKRKLIKSTLLWHMKAGTPEAVEELVAAVFGEGKVEEWFEYGGNPFCFKIITNAALTPEMNSSFSNMIKRVKNTRSHLQAIEICRKINQHLCAGVGTFTVYKPVAIMDGYLVDRVSDQKTYACVTNRQISKPAAIKE